MKNNNQKVVDFLAGRSLSYNKIRNIFVIITIILASSLPSLYALLVSAFHVEEIKTLSRVQHAVYRKVSDSQIEALRADNRLSFVFLTKSGRSFEYDGLKMIPIYTETDTATIDLGISAIDGDYPVKRNEIVSYRELLEDLGYEAKLGQIIKIVLPNGQEETFKITGFFEGKPYLENTYNILFSKEYAEYSTLLKNIDYNALALLDDVEGMSKDQFIEKVRAIGSDNGIQIKNSIYNRFFADSLDVSPVDYIAVIIITMIILFISVLVIYSVFYISVVSMSKQFGQLRTIGMTKKQVKRMVNKEAGVLCVIGAPIGIFIACIIAFALRRDGWRITNAIMIAMTVFVVNFICVKFSVSKPVKLASETSPIEAGKFLSESSPKLSINHKQIKHISPFTLAWTSVRRNKKKHGLTILSLAVGGILFMCAATCVVSFDMEKYSRQGFFEIGEFVISINDFESAPDENINDKDIFAFTERSVENRVSQPFDSETLEEIRNMDGVHSIKTFNGINVLYDYKTAKNEKDKISSFNESEIESFNTHLRGGAFDYNAMIHRNEVIISGADIANEIFGWDFELGDVVTIRYFNGMENIEEQFKIVAFIDVFDATTYNSGWFIVPQEKLESMFPGINIIDTIVVTVNDFESGGAAVEEQLANATASKERWRMTTLREQLAVDENAMTTAGFLIMGITLFIIAFSLISLINMLVAAVNSRKLEYAMLQSIGMSWKQLRSMLQWEGMMITAGNAGITLVAGSLARFVFIRVFQEMLQIKYLSYEMPILFFAAYFIVTMFVPVVITNIMLKNIEKKPLVERIREG